MAYSDTDDDIIISSALLIASTLYQRRPVNVRKRKRNSRARESMTAQRQTEKLTKNRWFLFRKLVARLINIATRLRVKVARLVAYLTWT